MVSILDVFPPEILIKFKKDHLGNLHGRCPSCQGTDNYAKFTIFVKTNTAYCHSSRTIFNIIECAALINHIICCSEGRQKL